MCQPHAPGVPRTGPPRSSETQEEGAFEKYHADIKAAGWESQAMMQGDSGGMISAQRGTLALQFIYNKDDHTGVVVAYSMPE